MKPLNIRTLNYSYISSVLIRFYRREHYHLLVEQEGYFDITKGSIENKLYIDVGLELTYRYERSAKIVA